jgi:hypothetical protein
VAIKTAVLYGQYKIGHGTLAILGGNICEQCCQQWLQQHLSIDNEQLVVIWASVISSAI